ncbi:hypothetical protein, partial [Sphingomonas sp. 10B4]|uniref:hypothetical protein n=1 Tax=Sphingomonas sp. 10B4 TaxID=3048575 RepID=UPI002B239CCC
MAIGSAKRCTTPIGSGTGTGSSGSGSRPLAWSSRATSAPPKRRASGARGRAASWSIVSMPSRLSSSIARLSSRSARVGRGASASIWAAVSYTHL